MPEDRLIELIIKQKLAQITMAEQKQLFDLLNISNRNRNISGAMDEIFASSVQYEVSEEHVNAALAKMHEKQQFQINNQLPKKNSRLRSLWYKISIAASIIGLIGLGILLIQYSNRPVSPKQIAHLVETNKASTSHLILPDGTKVWLNNGTRLTYYDKNFGEKCREVTLEGEAYFDVIKDKSHPFIVHTSTMDIMVLGTTFNVRAYKDEKNTQATLVRGLIEVILKNKNNEKITLKPNEKLTVQNAYSSSQTSANNKTTDIPEIVLITLKPGILDSSFQEIQWVKNNFSFDQEKLKDILISLEKRYHIKFEIMDETALDRRFSGIFENENINEIMETLKLSIGFNYKIEKDRITIY